MKQMDANSKGKIDPVGDLVMAMLAVNGWRLDQSGDIFDGLIKEGLLEPDKIITMSDEELFHALTRAGYTKSAFVKGLICDRLKDMASKLFSGDAEKIEKALLAKDIEQLKKILLDIKGVGPKVFDNFCLLQRIK